MRLPNWLVPERSQLVTELTEKNEALKAENARLKDRVEELETANKAAENWIRTTHGADLAGFPGTITFPKRVLALAALMLPLFVMAQAPPYIRNFFDTNANPVVQVTAGSNVFVGFTQAGQTRTYKVDVPASTNTTVYGSNVVGAVSQATHATNADNAVNATNFWGVLQSSNLPPGLSSSNFVGNFTGNGSGLTNIDGATSLTSNSWWLATNTPPAFDPTISNSYNGTFTGNGGSLTNLNGTNIFYSEGGVNFWWIREPGGLLVLTNDGDSYNISFDTTGSIVASGNITAGSFTGDASSLTNLDASQLTSGTVPAAALNLTNRTASGLTLVGVTTNSGIWTGGITDTNYATGNWVTRTNGTLTLGPTNAGATITLNGQTGNITNSGANGAMHWLTNQALANTYTVIQSPSNGINANVINVVTNNVSKFSVTSAGVVSSGGSISSGGAISTANSSDLNLGSGTSPGNIAFGGQVSIGSYAHRQLSLMGASSTVALTNFSFGRVSNIGASNITLVNIQGTPPTLQISDGWLTNAANLIVNGSLTATNGVVIPQRALSVVGTNCTFDLSTNYSATPTLTLATNVYMMTPANLVAGQNFMIQVYQDATGGWALTFNTNQWKFPSAQQLTITTNAGAGSLLSCTVDRYGTNVWTVQTLNFQ